MKTVATAEVNIKEQISVIIPTYNGAIWLPKTLDKVLEALSYAHVGEFEVLVVNDGSTDDTVAVVKDYAKNAGIHIKILTQPNSGRFVARQKGANSARYQRLLFVDTRVFIGKRSLAYVLKQQQRDPSRRVWCSHVRVDKTGNIYARFWDAFAFIAWRKYFKRPRDISYGIKEFDDYPKGTTCFVIDKTVLQDANRWFVKNTMDLKTSNDDTLLLRHIAAEEHSINISPDFWCLYHARTSFGQYSRHVYHRGKVLIDGFLRNDGNRYYVPLIIFLVITALLPVALLVVGLLWPQLLMGVVALGLACWLLVPLILLLLGLPLPDAISVFLLLPAFALLYSAGIWSAFYNTQLRGRNPSE